MATNWDQLIEDVGEPYFATADHPIGHGDIDLTRQWCEALGLPRNGNDYSPPKGFVWIQDAECDSVALVPVDLAPHFLKVLNYEPPCSLCGGTGFIQGTDGESNCSH